MSTLLRTFGPVSGPLPKRNRRRNPFWRFRRVVFAIGLAGLMVIGAAIYFVNQTPIPDDPFEELQQTSLICTSEVATIGGCTAETSAAQLSAGEDRELLTFDEIPEHVILTTLAAEDRRFYSHKGVDPKGLSRAIYQTAIGNPVQGGSTITQQLVKLSLLNNEQSVERKAKEAALAIQLEKKLDDKDLILERYHNQIYYGRNAYGIQAAARIYFEKDVSDLTVAEAALLASQIRSPGRDPLKNPELTRVRVAAVVEGVDVVIADMKEPSGVTPEQVEQARQEDVVANLQEFQAAESLGDVRGAEAGSEYFLETVRVELEKLYPQGQSYTGGYRVYTTLDLAKQKQAYDTVVNNRIENEHGFGSSIVTIDSEGRVVTMVGGTDFDNKKFNLATNGIGNGPGRQPGSTFKPFALAALIEDGSSAKSLFITPEEGLVLEGANDGKDWKPGGRRSGGKPYIDAVEGLERSSNHVYAGMAIEITPERIIETANEMGVRSELAPFNSVVLGTENVAPIDMAVSYSTFEREGLALRPALIERIENANGDVLCWYPDANKPEETNCEDQEGRTYESKERPARDDGVQAIEPQTAGNVTAAMEGVVVKGHGTGKRARVEGRRVAGKTGTTQKNADAWFVGYSCDVTTAVWVGNNDNEKLVDPETGAEIGGGGLPATMWSEYMTAYLADAPECTDDQWPASKDYQGEVLNKDLKNLDNVIPCYNSGIPEDVDPSKGGNGDDRFINCIPFDASNPNDPNNPNNPNSRFFFGNPDSPVHTNGRNNPNNPNKSQ